MMKIKFLAFPFIFFLLVFCNGCKKEPITSPESPSKKPEGLYEVITFRYGPGFWETCQERDTIMISKTRNGIIIDDRTLDLDMSRSTENSYHFRKELSNITGYSLTYYPNCDSISYRFSESWTNYGNGYKGRKLDTSPCVRPPSFPNCSTTSTNQICVNEQAYALEYGAIIPYTHNQRASICLWSGISLNADSTDVESFEYGNVLRLGIPFTSMDNLVDTYKFSDGSLTGSFYVNADFTASEEPNEYYYFDTGTLNIEMKDNEYVFTFEIGHCVMIRGTGYFDGLFFEW